MSDTNAGTTSTPAAETTRPTIELLGQSGEAAGACGCGSCGCGA